jgi:hypothetical protein
VLVGLGALDQALSAGMGSWMILCRRLLAAWA